MVRALLISMPYICPKRCHGRSMWMSIRCRCGAYGRVQDGATEVALLSPKPPSSYRSPIQAPLQPCGRHPHMDTTLLVHCRHARPDGSVFSHRRQAMLISSPCHARRRPLPLRETHPWRAARPLAVNLFFRRCQARLDSVAVAFAADLRYPRYISRLASQWKLVRISAE